MGLMRPRRVVSGTRKKEKNHHFVIKGILDIHVLMSFCASILCTSDLFAVVMLLYLSSSLLSVSSNTLLFLHAF